MKTFLARWFRRQPQTTGRFRGQRLSMEGLERRLPLAANILVATEFAGEQVMQEYDPNGTLVDAVVIPPGGVAEKARDLVADANGDVHVYNGTDTPYLSTHDSDTDSWTHRTLSGWSTFSSSYYGGIGVSGDYVFATDMWTGGVGSPKGIVRFNLADGTSTRFDNLYSYTDLTVGLDGLLYAHYSRTLRVYDPETLSLQRTVQLPFSINGQSQIYRGVAVDASGDIFAASWQEMVHHFDGNGVVQDSITLDGPGGGLFGNLTDIDVSADGQLVLGSYWGHVVQMNTDFTDVSYFSAGSKSVFVAFAAGGQPALPSFGVGDLTTSEGDVGSTVALFEVSLSAPNSTTVTVDYQTIGGSATSGVDFTPASGTLTFAPDETVKTVAVDIVGDLLDEDDETFQLVLANPMGAVLGDGQGVATIIDDDTVVLPSLSIDNLFVNEGDSGSVDAVFDVTLSAASGQPVSVNFATTSGSASAGSDYTATSGSLTFAAGETTKPITVPIIPDQVDEFSESFYVDLSSPSGATISDSRGIATILDDDTASFSIADTTVVEGDTGTTSANFIVSLSTPSASTVRVDYDTADGTAIAGADYTAASGTLAFAPGETSKIVSVSVTGDVETEPDEDFNVVLSSPFFASISDGTASGTIQDDDYDIGISIDDVFKSERFPDEFDFTVTLSSPSSQSVTVDYSNTITLGFAEPDVDFVADSGTITFAPGETSKTLSVTVIDDTIDELTEEFYVDLYSPAGAYLADSQGEGIIPDDDTAVLSVADVTVIEGDSGTTFATFDVNLSTSVYVPVTVDYATSDWTGTAGSDYTAVAGSLTFEPGETSKSVTVQIHGDDLHERDELFYFDVSATFNASHQDDTALGIIDDDDMPSFSVSDASVAEGDSGTVQLIFTVSLSNPSEVPASVQYATTSGTATAGVDYQSNSGTLVFDPFETSKTVAVSIIGDLDAELDETLNLILSQNSGALMEDAFGEGTIVDND